MKRKDRDRHALTKGVDGLFRKNKVTRYPGRGRLAGPGQRRGRRRRRDADGAGREAHHHRHRQQARRTLPGVELDGERIGTSTEALAYPEVPSTWS